MPSTQILLEAPTSQQFINLASLKEARTLLNRAETAVEHFYQEELRIEQAKQAEAARLAGPIPPGTRVKYRDTNDKDVFGIVAASHPSSPSAPDMVWAFWESVYNKTVNNIGWMPRHKVTIAEWVI